MRRIPQFDYIRVIALLGILICHSLFESADYGWLGRYLALTFNFLFLILSAFLFGLVWEKKGRPSYNKNFLIGRIEKLSKIYYPFLAILFLFLYLSQDYFSVRNIVSHTLYLPWFDKINGYGHLWFMTMIVICYTGCYLISKVRFRFENDNLLIYSILGGVIMDYMLSSMGLPGYMFPYLVGYVIIFYNADNIIGLVRRIKLPYNILQFILINMSGVLLFNKGIFNTNSFIAYLLGMLCLMSIFCFMMTILKNVRESKIIVWLSGISFEIYLVHEFFLGRYSIYGICSNPIIGFILLILLSIIAAIMLRLLYTSMSHMQYLTQKSS